MLGTSPYSLTSSPWLRGHERELGIGTVINKLLGESTKEESTEHGTESKVLWRPHATRETPGAKVVEGGEIGDKETASANKSDGVIRTATSTLDN